MVPTERIPPADTGRDPWRHCCPRGHHALKRRLREPTWKCRTCRRNGHDPYWTDEQLIDKRAQARNDDGTWCGP